MRAATRMRIRRGVAQALATSEWPEIDQTLIQFDIPTNDQWAGGDKVGYILAMTGHASDSDLLEIAEYCEVNIGGEVAQQTQLRIWPRSGLRLFISHLSTRRAICNELSERLQKYGIVCFVAHDAINPDELWQREIESGLRTADALLALLEPDFHASFWTDQEVGWAKGREIPVYCLRHEQDPYGFMAERQGIPVPDIDDAQGIADRVYGVVSRRSENKSKLIVGMLDQLSDSRNYQISNLIAERINQLDSWEPSHNELLLRAISGNRQVREANAVTDLLRPHVELTGGEWPL